MSSRSRNYESDMRSEAQEAKKDLNNLLKLIFFIFLALDFKLPLHG
jgi:hypothetical protein